MGGLPRFLNRGLGGLDWLDGGRLRWMTDDPLTPTSAVLVLCQGLICGLGRGVGQCEPQLFAAADSLRSTRATPGGSLRSTRATPTLSFDTALATPAKEAAL